MLPRNIIELLYNYLYEGAFKKKAELLRQCSKYINKIISNKYFSNITIDMNKPPIFFQLRHFVHKYNLLITITNISSYKQLAYINTFNVKSIQFSNTFNKLYIEYLISNTTKNLIFGTKFNKKIKKHILPNTIEHITFGKNYRQYIKKNNLPTALKTLTFKKY